jgi:hypothetical protein
MSVSDFEISDYFNWPNAGRLGECQECEGSEPGVVPFHIEWKKSRDRRRFRYEPGEWRANMVINEAKAEWEGETAKAHYVSGPRRESHSPFAEVGYERNGVFFR